MTEREFLTVPEASALLQIHEITMYRLIKKNKIPHFRLGGTGAIRIPKDFFERMAKK